MTDPITQAREIVSGMTPGKYRAINAHDMLSDPHPERVHVWAYTPEVLHPGQSSLWPDGMQGTEVANCEESSDPEANAAGIILATNLLRTLTSEGAEEALARELAWQLGDTMGDARNVFLSGEMHSNGERWRKTARAVISHLLAAALQKGADHHGE